MAGDFDLFLNSKLDKQDWNPTVKKKCLAELIDLKKSYKL